MGGGRRNMAQRRRVCVIASRASSRRVGRVACAGHAGGASVRPARSAGRDRLLPSFMRMMRLAWRATSGSWVTMMMVWPGGVKLVEEREDLLAGAAVEVSGGFVGEQDRRAGRPAPARSRRAAAGRRRAGWGGAACGRPGRRSPAPPVARLRRLPPAAARSRSAAARRSSAP